MTYSIICNARKGNDLGISKLGLVDRSKSKSYWWTSDNPNLLMKFEKKEAALFSCKRLRKNNPVVVNSDIAIRIINEQAINLENLIDDFDSEGAGWDAHKGSF